VCTVAGPPPGTPYPSKFISDVDFTDIPGISCQPIESRFLRRALNVTKILIRVAGP